MDDEVLTEETSSRRHFVYTAHLALLLLASVALLLSLFSRMKPTIYTFSPVTDTPISAVLTGDVRVEEGISIDGELSVDENIECDTFTSKQLKITKELTIGSLTITPEMIEAQNSKNPVVLTLVVSDVHISGESNPRSLHLDVSKITGNLKPAHIEGSPTLTFGNVEEGVYACQIQASAYDQNATLVPRFVLVDHSGSVQELNDPTAHEILEHIGLGLMDSNRGQVSGVFSINGSDVFGFEVYANHVATIGSITLTLQKLM
jgi:hypothetical protein